MQVWSADEKVLMFSGHFDAFQQQHSCDHSQVQCSVAFRFSFIRSLHLYMVPHGGNDLDGMFPFFLQADGSGAGN